MSAKSSILIRPAGMVPIVTSKNTIGFFGFGGRTCHSTLPPPPPPPDAINFSRTSLTLQATPGFDFGLAAQAVLVQGLFYRAIVHVLISYWQDLKIQFLLNVPAV